MIYNKNYLEAESDIEYDIILIDPMFQDYKDYQKKVKGKYEVAFVNDKNYDEMVSVLGVPDVKIIWTFPVGNGFPLDGLTQKHIYVCIYTNGNPLPTFNGEYNHNLDMQPKGYTTQKQKQSDGSIKIVKTRRVYVPGLQKIIPSVVYDQRGVKDYIKSEYLPFIILDSLGEGKTGTKVWDACAGTGTFGKLCKRLGYNYTGYEIDKDKVNKANWEIDNMLIESPRIEKLKINMRYEESIIKMYNSRIEDSKKIIGKLEEYLEMERNNIDHTQFQYTKEYQERMIEFLNVKNLWNDKLFMKKYNIQHLLDLKFTKSGKLTMRSQKKLEKVLD